MTADIVNFRKARKAKARASKEREAARNRLKFGRTKAERTAANAETHLTKLRLEAHRLGPDEDERDT